MNTVIQSSDTQKSVVSDIQRPDEDTIASGVGPPSGFGKDVNDYLNQYVVVADAKVGALVGANLTIAALLLSNQPAASWPLRANWIAVLCFGVSALIGTIALYPRLPSRGNSLIFWEDIVSRKIPSEYLAHVQQLDSSQVEREYATQNFYISKVLHSKYRIIRWCVILFMVGILCAAISIALTN